MLLLMMELRGRFNTKMIKKARFGDVYFDEMGAFISIDRDKVTGAVCRFLSPRSRRLIRKPRLIGRSEARSHFQALARPQDTSHAASICQVTRRGSGDGDQFHRSTGQVSRFGPKSKDHTQGRVESSFPPRIVAKMAVGTVKCFLRH